MYRHMHGHVHGHMCRHICRHKCRHVSRHAAQVRTCTDGNFYGLYACMCMRCVWMEVCIDMCRDTHARHVYRHAHRYAAVAMLLAAVLVEPTAVGEEAGVHAGCMRVDGQAGVGVGV